MLKMYKILIVVVFIRLMMYLERVIEVVGMEGFFNFVFVVEDVYRGKFDFEMYLYVVEWLGFGNVLE